MAIVNLQSIIGKARRLTGSSDITQLPDVGNPTPSNPYSVGVVDYLNSFYLYDFPAQFRSLKLKDKYYFNTVSGVDTYAFNSELYTTIEQPAYCMKRELAFFNDPWPFYGANFNWQSQTNFATGNGTTGPYSGTTTGNPIIRSVNNNPNTAAVPNVPGVSQGYSGYQAGRVQNILITATNSNGNTQNVTDDGNGNLIGDCSAGTINYMTGAIAGLTFTSSVTSGQTIQIQYNPVTLSIPLSILFFQNQFTLRPVPDIGYTIEMTVYRQPSQALTSNVVDQTGTPELSEWWECLAIGTAKKIYEDRLDFDGVSAMDKMLKERYDICYTRTYAQLGKQQMSTLFRDQLSNGSLGGFPFGNSGGTL